MSDEQRRLPGYFGTAEVSVHPSRASLGAAAAARAAEFIRAAIGRSGRARIIVATGNSQLDFIDALMDRGDLALHLVEVFHMDEYVGIAADHPASFRRWVRTRVADRAKFARVNYLEGDAADLGAEISRYTRLLLAAPIDLAFVGFGENGHIAFNDPPFADFDDPATVKVVTLDPASLRQQVGEGHFKDLESVPKKAVTMTCSGLLRAASWVCSVPERRKAAAVRRALLGPISADCPASVVRRHPSAAVFLDLESASLLPGHE